MTRIANGNGRRKRSTRRSRKDMQPRLGTTIDAVARVAEIVRPFGTARGEKILNAVSSLLEV